jgi:hypothetical protein
MTSIEAKQTRGQVERTITKVQLGRITETRRVLIFYNLYGLVNSNPNSLDLPLLRTEALRPSWETKSKLKELLL